MEIKDRIILACRELARPGGFYNINMDELAAHAGVSKRTVYRYFRSKEDIIEATLDAFMAEASAEVDRMLASETDPAKFVANMFKYLLTNGQFIINPAGLRDLRQHYPLLWQKIDNFRTKRVETVIEFLINNSHSSLLKEIDRRIISAVILASIQSVLTPEFILDNGLTFEETASQLGKLLIAAFT
ncbi:MAG: TetR/AcrR family transcriptional regulator [Syntrophomonadaceae bacterium]